MNNRDLMEKLLQAKSLEEVKEILKDKPDDVVNRVYQEIQDHRSDKAEKLDLDELDAVSGGCDRNWVTDGCAATCEEGSWCSSNDYCRAFEVTYADFWVTCPDGHEHVYNGHTCVRCGYNYGGGDRSFKPG